MKGGIITHKARMLNFVPLLLNTQTSLWLMTVLCLLNLANDRESTHTHTCAHTRTLALVLILCIYYITFHISGVNHLKLNYMQGEPLVTLCSHKTYQIAVTAALSCRGNSFMLPSPDSQKCWSPNHNSPPHRQKMSLLIHIMEFSAEAGDQ